MVSETLIYCSEDKEVCKLLKEETQCKVIPYSTPKHSIVNGRTILAEKELLIFGNHNLQNLNAARLVCNEIGVSDTKFYSEIANFRGASNRLELVKKDLYYSIYKDFAHSPSKLKATCLAMKKQFINRKLVSCLELHTFSSLNKEFLKQYKGCMDTPDTAIIYFNPEIGLVKKIKPITKIDIINGFNRKDLLIFSKIQELVTYLRSLCWKDQNLLMMSSGNFNNLDLNNIF